MKARLNLAHNASDDCRRTIFNIACHPSRRMLRDVSIGAISTALERNGAVLASAGHRVSGVAVVELKLKQNMRDVARDAATEFNPEVGAQKPCGRGRRIYPTKIWRKLRPWRRTSSYGMSRRLKALVANGMVG